MSMEVRRSRRMNTVMTVRLETDRYKKGDNNEGVAFKGKAIKRMFDFKVLTFKDYLASVG